MNFGVSNQTQNYENPSQLPSKTTSKSNSISYGVGGFARYYKKIADNLFFLIDGNISYMYQIQKLANSNNDPNYIYSTSNTASQEVRRNNIYFGISPGLAYFITPKLGIKTAFGSIYYNNATSKNKSLSYDNHNNSNSYGINLDITTFYLGLEYYF